MRIVLLLLISSYFVNAQITKFTYIEESSLTPTRTIEVYHNSKLDVVLIHFEGGWFGNYNIDYKIYDFNDTTLIEINSKLGLAIKSKPELSKKENSEEDFQYMRQNEGSLFVEQTLNEYNPFASGDSVLVKHEAELIDNEISNIFEYSIPYVTANINDKIYLVKRKTINQVESTYKPYYNYRNLEMISKLDSFPIIQYELVEGYSQIFRN